MSRSNFKPSEQLHVSLNSDSELRISNRAPTNIGPQGAHASAYHLIEMLVKSISGYSNVEEAAKRLFSFFSDLKGTLEYDNAALKDFLKEHKPSAQYKLIFNNYEEGLEARNKDLENIIDQAIDKINLLITTKKTNAQNAEQIKILILKGSKIPLTSLEEKILSNVNIDTLCQEVDKKFNLDNSNEIIQELAATYLTIRNKIPYTAFPSEGNLSSLQNEGAIIKAACQKLAEINRSLEEKPVSEKSNLNKKSNEIAQQILNTFWHPKIPNEDLIDLDDPQQEADWAKLVKKKYTAGTQPRNNDLNILCNVASNHLDLIAKCFPHFTDNETLEKMIYKKFINLIATNGKISGVQVGWDLDKTAADKLSAIIHKKLFALGIYQPPSHSNSQKTSSNEDSGSTTPESKKGTTTAAITESLRTLTIHDDSGNKQTILDLNESDLDSRDDSDYTGTPSEIHKGASNQDSDSDKKDSPHRKGMG